MKKSKIEHSRDLLHDRLTYVLFCCCQIDEDRVSCISAVIMLQRSDKQPDRVEISPEQLSDASTKAEVGY
jgi:hypothetical protein